MGTQGWRRRLLSQDTPMADMNLFHQAIPSLQSASIFFPIKNMLLEKNSHLWTFTMCGALGLFPSILPAKFFGLPHTKGLWCIALLFMRNCQSSGRPAVLRPTLSESNMRPQGQLPSSSQHLQSTCTSGFHHLCNSCRRVLGLKGCSGTMCQFHILRLHSWPPGPGKGR